AEIERYTVTKIANANLKKRRRVPLWCRRRIEVEIEFDEKVLVLAPVFEDFTGDLVARRLELSPARLVVALIESGGLRSSQSEERKCSSLTWPQVSRWSAL